MNLEQALEIVALSNEIIKDKVSVRLFLLLRNGNNVFKNFCDTG